MYCVICDKDFDDALRDCPHCDEDLSASVCSLSRWPTVEEVRAHYLTPGTGWAYALVRGFNDYGPVVAQFYVILDRQEVWVDFPDGPAMTPVGMLDQQGGFTVEFLCLANSQDQAQR